MHQRGCTDHREQPGDDEQFALAQPPDQPEHRIEQQPPDRDQRNDRADGVKRQGPPAGRVRVGGHSRHRHHDRDQRDDRQILEQQDRESPLALRRVEVPVSAKHRQHLRSRR